MSLRWTRLAIGDLLDAQEYIAQDNAVAARSLALRIHQAAQRLADQPAMGRPGQVSGTREFAVSGTPYLIVYRSVGDRVELLRIWHGRRDRGSDPIR